MKDSDKESRSVTSHNQQGGITAYEVNADNLNVGETPNQTRDLPKWIKLVGVVVTVVAGIAATITAVISLAGGF